MSIAAVSTAGATPDAMLPSAAMIISCRPFEKRRVAPCTPVILQLPLKCEGRGVRYGATDTPLWLEAAAVWLEGRSGRLAGGKCKSSQAARERAERRTRPQRDSGNIRLDGFRLGVWRLSSMLIFGQVAGQARWRRRPPQNSSSRLLVPSQIGKRPPSTSLHLFDLHRRDIVTPASSRALHGTKNTVCAASSAPRRHDRVATHPI